MIHVETMPFQHHRDEPEPSFSSSHHHHVSPSPSFSSYSSETLADIAARVIDELRRDTHSTSDEPWETDINFTTPNENSANHNDNNSDDEDDEFEFAAVSTESAVSADDIFYNGEIKPLYYPIFGKNLQLNNDGAVSSVSGGFTETPKRRRLPLRTLMYEEAETTASCSSSTDESVDLEGIAEGSYCVWSPNSVGIERKKSSSTGSGSKRWKLKNLLLRSHSDGKVKQPVMFQIPANNVSPSVEHGGKNRSKNKSFLPYRPELVGLFSNVNGLARNLNPF